MKKIYWLYLAATLYWIGLYTYSPILPVYIKDIVVDLGLAGSILSMYGLFQILVRLPLGIASDVTGKRRMLAIVSLVFVFMGPLVLSISKNVGGLYLGRALTGVAAGAWVPISALILLESEEEIYKTTAVLSFISGFGRILAVSATPLLVSSALGYAPAFWAASVSAGLAILIFLLIRNTKVQKRSVFSLKSITDVVIKPSILLPGFMNAVLQFGNFASTFTFIPLIARNLGLSNGQISFMMNAFLISSMLSNITLSKMMRHVKVNWISLFSFVVMAAGLVIAAFAGNFWSLLLSQVIIGISFGIGYPLFMGFSVAAASPENRTIAMGSFQSVYAIGMFAGPAFSTFLAERVGVPVMMTTIGGMIVALGAVFLGVYWQLKENPNKAC